MTTSALRALIVEDVEEDAELIVSQLTKCGFNPLSRRVDTVERLAYALDSQSWDLILTDYTMPALTVPDVLRLLHERNITAPCILVSGTATEDTARAAVRLGVDDFVNKNNLAALGPVVRRALDDQRPRHERLGTQRIRLTGGQELRVVEWSDERGVLDGEAPLLPGNDRDGLLLGDGEATRVRLRILQCEVRTVSPQRVVYRSVISLTGR